MKRRRFISSMTLVVTGAALGTGTLISSCNGDIEAEPFSAEDIQLLDEIGETIIPATAGSPGAKAAKIGEFMKVYVTDCYKPDDQVVFLDGIDSFKRLCRKKYGKDFLNLPLEQRKELLLELDKEVAKHADARQKKPSKSIEGDAIQAGKTQADKTKIIQNAEHYFTMMRNLTLFGYFTSEPGATKALRYLQTPGYYSGDIPYKKGDKSWAI